MKQVNTINAVYKSMYYSNRFMQWGYRKSFGWYKKPMLGFAMLFNPQARHKLQKQTLLFFPDTYYYNEKDIKHEKVQINTDSDNLVAIFKVKKLHKK